MNRTQPLHVTRPLGWTDADATAASHEGWELRQEDADTALITPLTHPRLDDDPTTALAYVMLRARQGSDMHRRAWKLEGESQPTEIGYITALNYVLGESLNHLVAYCSTTIPGFGQASDTSHLVASQASRALRALKPHLRPAPVIQPASQFHLDGDTIEALAVEAGLRPGASLEEILEAIRETNNAP